MTPLDVKNLDQKQTHEDEVVQSIEEELTDEQLLQMAEGSCSWGANCSSGSC
jgi:hypothetical protein